MLYKIWADLVKLVVTATIVTMVTAFFVRRRRQPLPKSVTFRVDDIPLDHTDILLRNLKALAEQDPDLQRAARTMAQRSLTARDKRSFCATISITTTLPGEYLCARLCRSGKDYPYGYTCRFDGITPLYEGKDGADVDIIAVPGLGSHALGSWKSPIGDEVWLRDFLPEDVPNIRVLLYGYDTTLPGSLSKQSIADLGGAFLEHITAFRANDGTSHRPIILIGHSLGGLLIKEALIRARSRQKNAISDFSETCFGLLFFGVPNLGLRNEQLRTLVRGQPNKALIDDLLVDSDSEPSTFLRKLASQFSESCKDHYRVATFFERALSPTLELSQDGQWRKTGAPSLLVTERSATSTGLVAMADEDNVSLNTDHSGLVKYHSRNQGDYPIVMEKLRRLVDEAKLEVSKRFAEQSLYQPESAATLACLRSLAFDGMDSRQNMIDTATTGTCGWLLTHDTLLQWTCENRGLLWIKGKPGSGKSTLLKYAFREIPATYGPGTLAFSFFFHGRGSELQKSPLGFYRSFLHDLLKRCPGALIDMIDYFEGQRKTVGEPGDKWKWELQQLQTFLESSLARILQRFSVIFCIDALDECGEESAVELIQYFKHLLSNLPSTSSRLGVCFSCRHYPILDLSRGLTIVLDEENSRDIDIFVRTRLSMSHMDPQIQNTIYRRARGVFMWAYLVVNRVLQMKRRGESNLRINAEIRKLPQDLDDLYTELIQGVEDRSDALRLMQWICFSTRPLTTNEVQWAMSIDPDSAYKSFDECYHSGEFVTDENLDGRIKTLSCGLVETVPCTDEREDMSYAEVLINNVHIVQFIHQSVQDFFLVRGLLLLGQTSAPNLVGPTAHCHLSRTCLLYLKLVVKSIPVPQRYETGLFPLLHYATTSWLDHVKLGEPAETSPNDLLRCLGWPVETLIEPWIDIYQEIGPREELPERGSNLVHVLSRYGFMNLLSCLLDTGKVDVNSKDGSGRTPLSLAIIYGHEAIFKILLDTGKSDVDSKDNEGWTPLLYAARHGNEALVKILLDTGKVDVNAESIYGERPLSFAVRDGDEAMFKNLLKTGKVDVDSTNMSLLRAAERGHEAMFNILLDTGKVDVDSKDGDGRTPLSHAAAYGNEAMFKLLLKTGKVDVDSKDGHGQTPLSLAAENGHEAVVKLLLDTDKVDVDVRDTSLGRTPLSSAAYNGHGAVVRLLVETGKVDVDTKDEWGWTPLVSAAVKGHEAVVRLLVETGKVDVESKDGHGRTPLSLAAEKGHEAVVKLLVETGKVDVDSKDGHGRTPLSLAAEEGHEAVVKLLLETDKVDVDIRDTSLGKTPLSWAAAYGREAVVKILLETGKVDVNKRDTNWARTPLSWAAAYGREAVAKILLETGKVDVNSRDVHEYTPLSQAVSQRHMGMGHMGVAKLLLEMGKVDIEPLQWTRGGRDRAVVKLLQETGYADSNDKATQTPLWWVANNDREARVNMPLPWG